MTLQSSGSISMSQINAEFGKGNDLNSYRGTKWYTDAGGSGTFSTGAISYTDFYGKRLSAPAPSTIDVLVVAGGGGGTHWEPIYSYGGCGGGGGMCEQYGRSISAGATYTVTVGAGGSNNGYFAGSSSQPGYNGSNSSFDTITAIGGGGGGSTNYDRVNWPNGYTVGQNGGSGGGGPKYIHQVCDENGCYTYTLLNDGGTAIQGNSGGATGYGYSGLSGGGGGGAGGIGISPFWDNLRNQRNGRYSSISGTSVIYSSGGNVTSFEYNPPGGYQYAYVNSGEGAFSSSNGTPWNNGSSGGSGVVILRYPNTYPTATVTGSPTYTNTGGYHIYKFTGSGTIRW